MKQYRKSTPITTEELCSQGCGTQAKFKSPRGIFLCGKGPASCPVNKKKNSNGLKRAYEDGRKDCSHFDGKRGWSKGLTVDTDSRVAARQNTRNQDYANGKWKGHVSGVAKHPELRWKRNRFQYSDTFGSPCVLESFNELIVANELDRNHIRWTRPSKFTLSSGKTYEPDFYLIDHQVYLDPKAKYFGTTKYQGYHKQDTQLAKIALFEQEYATRCLILWEHDKGSFLWNNILSCINEV